MEEQPKKPDASAQLKELIGTLGEFFKEFRLSKGMSQARAAQTIGVTVGAVSLLERGVTGRMQSENLQEISKFTEQPIEKIVAMANLGSEKAALKKSPSSQRNRAGRDMRGGTK